MKTAFFSKTLPEYVWIDFDGKDSWTLIGQETGKTYGSYSSEKDAEEAVDKIEKRIHEEGAKLAKELLQLAKTWDENLKKAVKETLAAQESLSELLGEMETLGVEKTPEFRQLARTNRFLSETGNVTNVAEKTTTGLLRALSGGRFLTARKVASRYVSKKKTVN